MSTRLGNWWLGDVDVANDFVCFCKSIPEGRLFRLEVAMKVAVVNEAMREMGMFA